MVANRLKEYCLDPASCKYNILNLLNGFEVVDNIELSKSSRVLLNSFLENHDVDGLLKKISLIKPQIAKRFDYMLSCGFHGYGYEVSSELFSGMTDYEFCEEDEDIDQSEFKNNYPAVYEEFKKYDEDGKEMCAKHQPSRSDFGMALASLYIIKQLDDERLLETE